MAGRIPASGVAGERPTADLFGERVLRATAGGTVRFELDERDAARATRSQDALVGYLESCPFVVIGEKTGEQLDGRSVGRLPGEPPGHRATGRRPDGPQLYQPSGAAPS